MCWVTGEGEFFSYAVIHRFSQVTYVHILLLVNKPHARLDLYVPSSSPVNFNGLGVKKQIHNASQ